MSESNPTFPKGSVGANLMMLCGTWHDHIELFELDGRPLAQDDAAGSPGPGPFENLVYVDFDGRRFRLTNVHLRGRALSAKTFAGELRDGILVFDSLGPGAYENAGMSGGHGLLTFAARQLNRATDVYCEPDVIVITAPDQRMRHTVLYRKGDAIRTLTAKGTRVAPDCDSRHPLDPRGTEGPVHEEPFRADIWSHLVDD